jgi:hypothetical protein
LKQLYLFTCNDDTDCNFPLGLNGRFSISGNIAVGKETTHTLIHPAEKTGGKWTRSGQQPSTSLRGGGPLLLVLTLTRGGLQVLVESPPPPFLLQLLTSMQANQSLELANIGIGIRDSFRFFFFFFLLSLKGARQIFL